MTGARALVVSANTLFGDSVAALLEANGWRVTSKEADALRALSVLSRHPIDAVVIIGDPQQLSASNLQQEIRRRWATCRVVAVPTSPGASIDLSYEVEADEVVRSLRQSASRNEVDRLQIETAFEKVTKLTRRERTILRRMAAGDRPSDIARQLDVSPHTVRSHLANIHRKLDLHSRVDLIRLASDAGLLAQEREETMGPEAAKPSDARP
jgi:DNA-binding NarL/FixJ family response regulator